MNVRKSPTEAATFLPGLAHRTIAGAALCVLVAASTASASIGSPPSIDRAAAPVEIQTAKAKAPANPAKPPERGSSAEVNGGSSADRYGGSSGDKGGVGGRRDARLGPTKKAYGRDLEREAAARAKKAKEGDDQDQDKEEP